MATGVNMSAGRAVHKSANAAFFPEIAQAELGRNRRRGEENHQIPTRCVGTQRFRYAAVVALPTKAAYNDSLKEDRELKDRVNFLIEEERKMVYRGIVKNGVVVLGEGADLPDGTEVRVEPIARGESSSNEGPTLAEQFGDVIATVPNLPCDMAQQHDHYLHGAPKR